MFVDKTLIPGAPRAVGSALYAAGFRNVRLVLQQWNPNIRPSQARFDGKPPEVLMVSAMQIHSAPAYRLIRDAWQLGDDRPLILAGGPKAVYEPWDFFGLSPDGREGADAVVTGEEYVLLELLDRIVEMKRPGDTMRAAFERVRAGGLLDDIPGLVYAARRVRWPAPVSGQHGRATAGSRPRRTAPAVGGHGAVRASARPHHVVPSAAPG